MQHKSTLDIFLNHDREISALPGVLTTSFPRSFYREPKVRQTWIPALQTTGMTNAASRG